MKLLHYGRASLHPVFLDEIRACGVEIAESAAQIDRLRQESSERIEIHVRFAQSAQSTVAQLMSHSGGAIEVVACPVDLGFPSLMDVTSSSPHNIAAQRHFHEFCLIAANSDAQRETHAHALERLSGSWVRSIRQTTTVGGADPEEGPTGSI
ncbi:hypothetical protein [Burkholderia sp. Tr-20390]|uniref:hypothetical protein n=1 Tax=Burkholderia sp. Tr-20390 TaxID=2703904 RepID=UPI00197D9E36|nr:hypothetical protein [Burkholderia sp. Tr-20390]MBN3729516.1 hypothetical protein [Burkholderia sp. Tr-20390]